VKLYLLHDGDKVTLPQRIELEYLDGKDWAEVPGQTRTPRSPAGHRANVIHFPAISTAKLRVTFRHAKDGRTGLPEIEAWGDAVLPVTPAPPPAGNLALNTTGKGYPKASASFTSRFDKVEEVNDGVTNFNPTPHNRWTSYESPNKSDWLEIDLGEAKEIGRIELAIYDDRGGVQAPARYEVEYWDGVRWQPAADQKKAPEEPTGGQINEVRFHKVKTSRARVVFTHRGMARSGVTEIFIWPE
jgi:hypothetical protein